MTNKELEWKISVLEDKLSHIEPSPQTREEIKRLDLKVDELEKNTVRWKHFIWIIGILITLMTSVPC